jgi:hypothetical protein
MTRLRLAIAAAALLACASMARAVEPYDVAPSTLPIGSPFYRHLAFDFGLDIRDLVKLERRGFGRGEVVTLVLIAKSTSTTVKDLARRRLKDQVPLKDLAAETGLDYPTLLKNVRAIKEGIESKGEQNLPPPVFEPSPTPTPPKKRKKGKESASPVPSPAASPVASPALTVSPAPTARPSP